MVTKRVSLTLEKVVTLCCVAVEFLQLKFHNFVIATIFNN